MELLLGSAGIIGAVALLAYVAVDRARERAAARGSLQVIEGYDVALDDQRDRELQAPLRDRLLRPARDLLIGLGRRYTPAGYVESTARKLSSLGYRGDRSMDRFLAFRVGTVVAIPVVVFFTVLWDVSLVAGLLLGAALLIGPDAVLSRRVGERQTAIRCSLPDILDLLTISVEAGLGFEQALDRTITSVPGALSDEFGRMLGEVRAGAGRAVAMRAFEQRVAVEEVSAFALAIVQADTFGVPIGRVLRAQAEEMRVKRRQLAQVKAQKAPVKMMIPMVFCVFPALFVVVLGPAVISITKNL
ncbi:MAG: type II secretion system F family protein [Actinobacteria bacterium]|nr:type II secretion system F family protein [Actinomycetota bacterium]